MSEKVQQRSGAASTTDGNGSTNTVGILHGHIHRSASAVER